MSISGRHHGGYDRGGDRHPDEDEGFDEYERDAVKRIKAEQENDGNANKRELLPIRSTKGWEQR